MTKQENKQLDRVKILESLKTPLGFFVLLVLIVEVIFVITLGLTQDEVRTNIIYFLMAIIFVLIVIVTLLAIFRPEALSGMRYKSDSPSMLELQNANIEINDLEIRIQELDEYNKQLANDNQKLNETRNEMQKLIERNIQIDAELELYKSLRLQILGLLSGSSISLSEIVRTLNENKQQPKLTTNEILSVLGFLIEDGKVKKIGTRYVLS